MLDYNENKISPVDLNSLLHNLLGEIFIKNPELFPNKVKSQEDIETKVDVYRSMRRGSNTNTHEKNVDIKDIELVNQWINHVHTGCKKPNLLMAQMYTDIKQLKALFFRYTKAQLKMETNGGPCLTCWFKFGRVPSCQEV